MTRDTPSPAERLREVLGLRPEPTAPVQVPSERQIRTADPAPPGSAGERFAARLRAAVGS